MINSIKFSPNFSFFIISVIGAVYTKLMAELASYFLGQNSIHILSGILLYIIFFWGSHFFFNLINSRRKTFIIISIFILVFEMFSFQALYIFRPYTMYFSVILFVNLSVFLVILGYLSASVAKGKKNVNHTLLIAMIILAVVYILPFNQQFTQIPYILPLPLILLFVWENIKQKSHVLFTFSPLTTYIFLLIIAMGVSPIKIFSSQASYEDKVIFSTESVRFSINVTQWMDEYWLYLDQLKYISTIDEFLFYEPMVHPVSGVVSPKNVLIIGGDNGCALKEILKYNSVQKVFLVPFDSILLSVCRDHPVLAKMNANSLSSEKVTIEKRNILSYITLKERTFDFILIDLPDPRNIETNQYYTLEFYNFISEILEKDGVFITQAGSPYFATRAFNSINLTIQEAGFNTLPIHNQILTLGEWGWIIGSKNLSENEIKKSMFNIPFESIQTHWLNQESISLITSFGKDYVTIDTFSVNTINNPVAYKYYLEGTWNLE